MYPGGRNLNLWNSHAPSSNRRIDAFVAALGLASASSSVVVAALGLASASSSNRRIDAFVAALGLVSASSSVVVAALGLGSASSSNWSSGPVAATDTSDDLLGAVGEDDRLGRGLLAGV